MFYSLYDEYLKFYGLNLNINSQPEVSQGKPPSSTRFGKGYQILFHKSKTTKGSGSSQSSTSELQSYLTTTFEFVDSSDFDILQWWKEHQRYFPILVVMAKQILATPMSTVAMEQQFSASGNILDPTRFSMSPDSIEAQSCLDD